MIGISEEMIARIRESLAKVSGEGFLSIEDMDGYFVSRKKEESTEYTFMCTVDVDGIEAHVYLKL